MSDNLRG